MQLVRVFFLFLFALCLAAPGLHHMTGLFPDVELGGVTKKLPKLVLSSQAFLNGSFQPRFEKYVKRGSGVWPYLVKTDNQLNFTLFRQIANHYRSKVVLGRKDILIEKAYLPSSNAVRKVPARRLERKVQQLKRLQALLTERGVGFLLLISPSKPGLYPEIIPAAYSIAGRSERKNAYERMLPMLEESGLHLLDGHRWFEDLRRELPYPLFASSGTHWNDYGSCLMTERLLQEMERLMGKSLFQLSCEPVTVKPIPSYPDRDLSQLVNLWMPAALYQPAPYPHHKVTKPEGAVRPQVLFVGTSFLHAVLRYLDLYRIYRSRDFFYYFKRNFRYPAGTSLPFDKTEINWEQDVFSKDIIVIEINEAFVEKAGHGFVKAALKAVGEE